MRVAEMMAGQPFRQNDIKSFLGGIADHDGILHAAIIAGRRFPCDLIGNVTLTAAGLSSPARANPLDKSGAKTGNKAKERLLDNVMNSSLDKRVAASACRGESRLMARSDMSGKSWAGDIGARETCAGMGRLPILCNELGIARGVADFMRCCIRFCAAIGAGEKTMPKVRLLGSADPPKTKPV